jgi:hypothetical protein
MYIEILLTGVILQIWSKFVPIFTDCRFKITCQHQNFTTFTDTMRISKDL